MLRPFKADTTGGGSRWHLSSDDAPGLRWAIGCRRYALLMAVDPPPPLVGHQALKYHRFATWVALRVASAPSYDSLPALQVSAKQSRQLCKPWRLNPF